MVGFFYRRTRIPEGAQGRVNRLASAIPHVVTFPYEDHPGSEVTKVLVFEMSNRPRRFAVRCCDLLAVHKCVGPDASLTAAERAALRIGKGDARYLTRSAPSPLRADG